MKDNKGFTLIELLSVIVLIGLLLSIGIPGISRISKNMNQKSLNAKIKLINDAGILWGQNNKSKLQKDKCLIKSETINCKIISISKLIKEEYLEYDDPNKKNYNNPVDDSDMLNDCVYIYKKDNRVHSYYSSDNTGC